MENIYSRVTELVEAKKQKMTMAELFQSPTYASFIKRKAANIISGTFYMLRKEGFVASRQMEDRLLASLTIQLIHEPPQKGKEEITAYAADSGQFGQHIICINTACSLVSKQESREEQHMAVLGLLYHEIGHLLFTDYPTTRAWSYQLQRGRWFPKEPQGMNTVAGINLTQNMTDPEFLQVFSHCADSVDNCLEDGYVEREISLMCPGTGKDALAVMNMVLYETSEYLENDDPNNPKKNVPGRDFLDVLHQVLLYCEFGEIKIADDYNGPLSDFIYDCIEVVDDYKLERDPVKRREGVNELLCIMAPLIDKAIQEQKQQNQNQQGQQQGQQGQAGGAGSSGGASGNRSGDSSGNGAGQPSAADQICQAISALERAVGASSKNEGCSSEAVNNPGKAQNQGANGRQENGQGESGSKGPGGTGEGSLEAATREVNSLAETLASALANRQAEEERTKDLNKDGQDMDCSEFGMPRDVSVSVTRASEVSESNVAAYDKIAGDIQNISRGLQRDIKRVLKDRREGGKRKNLPFGRRLEVSSIVHGDGKYFSRNKLPTETPRLGVGLLVDESGSTSGALIQAATIASLVVEDFCRELDIPHLIYGYTSGCKDAAIVSYAEPREIDGSNRYRITGMRASGGTPTASAMAFMTKQMMKLPADVRLLIVITDGGSADNYIINGKERYIDRMIHVLRKDKVIVVAAGIGSDRAQVEAEFGDNFLDITDINMMPEQLVDLIKHNLVV